MKSEKINICRDPTSDEILEAIEINICLYELFAKTTEQIEFATYCRSYMNKHKDNKESIMKYLDLWSTDLSLSKVDKMYGINHTVFVLFRNEYIKHGIQSAKNLIRRLYNL